MRHLLATVPRQPRRYGCSGMFSDQCVVDGARCLTPVVCRDKDVSVDVDDNDDEIERASSNWGSVPESSEY